MATATLCSRMLGMARELVYAAFMGDGPVASAFKLAFQIPNLFRRLLGEGALTAAFVPIFKNKEKNEGEAAMWQAANATMSAVIIATLAIAGLAIMGISLFLELSDVTYTQDGEAVFPPWPIPILASETRLMLELLRLMFPYVVLVCLTALCMGILNARGLFFIPALGATLLNVVMIVTVLWIAPRWGDALEKQIFALGMGVLFAGVAQLSFQLPFMFRQGWRFAWITPWRNETVRQVVRKMIPGAIGVAAFQINVLVIQGVAFCVDRTIVASFDYGVRLMEFPQGVIGISLATYLLTSLSGLAADKRYDDFRATLREGVGLLLFLNLLGSVLLFTLARPIVQLLFERGAFTPDSTQRVALAVACLAPGLTAFSLANVLVRAFHALGDTKAPMMISVFCLCLNVAVALLLVGPLRQAGLGIAASTSAIANVYFLQRALRKKIKRLDFEPLRPTVLALAGATIVAGGVAWWGRSLWETYAGYETFARKLGGVFAPALLATAVYWTLCLWLRVKEAREISQLARRALSRLRTG